MEVGVVLCGRGRCVLACRFINTKISRLLRRVSRLQLFHTWRRCYNIVTLHSSVSAAKRRRQLALYDHYATGGLHLVDEHMLQADSFQLLTIHYGQLAFSC